MSSVSTNLRFPSRTDIFDFLRYDARFLWIELGLPDDDLILLNRNVANVFENRVLSAEDLVPLAREIVHRTIVWVVPSSSTEGNLIDYVTTAMESLGQRARIFREISDEEWRRIVDEVDFSDAESEPPVDGEEEKEGGIEPSDTDSQTSCSVLSDQLSHKSVHDERDPDPSHT